MHLRLFKMHPLQHVQTSSNSHSRMLQLDSARFIATSNDQNIPHITTSSTTELEKNHINKLYQVVPTSRFFFYVLSMYFLCPFRILFPFSVVFAEATASSFLKGRTLSRRPSNSWSFTFFGKYGLFFYRNVQKKCSKKELWKSFEDGEHIHSSYAHGIEKLCWWLKNVLFRSDFMKSSQQTPPSGKPREAHLAAMQKPAGRS